MPPISLSDSEWRVMALLWERPMTMPEIKKKLEPETGWSKHTVISFLNRMIAKGAIEATEARPARIYRPLIEKDESLKEETDFFVKRVYAGKTGLLVASLLEREKLTGGEIDELMDLLIKAREKRGGDK